MLYRNHLETKIFIVLLYIFYQHRTAYSLAIEFTRLITEKFCVEDECMVNPMYTLILIQQHVEEIL